MLPNLVSVIIPTYNRAHLILRALDSVKKQNYRPIEVIIIDDGGIDRTEELLKGYDFGDIIYTYIRHKKRTGPGGARNTAMRLSVGEYLAFIDSDDEWIRNDKIDMQINFLKKNPEYGFIATAWCIKGIGEVSRVFHFIDDVGFRKTALKYCPAHTSTWVFQRRIFEQIGGFWSHGAEDYEYLLRIGCLEKCFCIPVVTENYFNTMKGDYRANIIRNVFWTLFVCIKYRSRYPNFIYSLYVRFFRKFLVFKPKK